MKKKAFRKIAALLSACVFALSLSACGGQESGEQPVEAGGKLGGSKQEQGPEYSKEARTSIMDVRSYLEDGLPFAAAYLGYYGEDESDALPVWLQNNVPLLVARLPFLLDIPEECVVGEHGDLYCFVPRNEETALTVYQQEWEQLGNGAQPHLGEILYRCDYGEPILVFANYDGVWRNETDVEIEATLPDGSKLSWSPEWDAETLLLNMRTDADGNPLFFDFDFFGDMEEGYVPDAEWLPPTALGISGSWATEDGWMMDLGYEDAKDSGGVAIYEPITEDGETYLSRYCHGTWRMEDDCLYLDIYDPSGAMIGGSFPVLISPSGDDLYMMAAADGACPPFFAEGMTGMGLLRTYG